MLSPVLPPLKGNIRPSNSLFGCVVAWHSFVHSFIHSFITLRASSGTAYCNRSCLWVCACGWVYLCVGGTITTITRNCIDPHQTGFVGKCSDHLQLITLCPGMGLRQGENFWLRLTTASAQRLRHSERFFHLFIHFAQNDKYSKHNKTPPTTTTFHVLI